MCNKDTTQLNSVLNYEKHQRHFVLLLDVVRKFPKTQEGEGGKNKKKEEGRMSAMRRKGDEKGFYEDRATFVELDVFDSWRRVVFFRNGSGTAPSSIPTYNVLVLDAAVVSGNDMVLNSISIIREFIALNGVDDGNDFVVIVKSNKLNTFGRKLVHGQRLVSASLPSGLLDIERRTKRIGGGPKNNGSIVVATVGVDEYRRTIPYIVQKGDVVLEIGCHLGTTTVLPHDAAISNSSSAGGGGGGALGVDIGPNIIQQAQSRFPHVPFNVADAWRTSDLLRMKPQYLPEPSNKQTKTPWVRRCLYRCRRIVGW